MSGWPRKQAGRDYRDCELDLCSAREQKYTAKCYAQDNTRPDSFESDQYCAYEDEEGTLFPLSEGCCVGKDIPKDRSDGPIVRGCPGQCDNVRNPRAPQAESTGRKNDEDVYEDDDSGNKIPENKQIHKGYTLLLILILGLALLSTSIFILNFILNFFPNH